MADRTTKVLLTAQVNGYLSGMDQAAKKTRDLTKVTDEQKAALKDLSVKGGVALLAIGAAAAGAATLAIAKFAEFDQAMSYVDAATHETAGNMSKLRDAAIEAGARTVFSATEAANAIEELGKAGVSTKDILAGGLDGALDLAAAGGLGVADAAGIAATALKVFGLSGKDMGHVADLLAAGAGKAMGSVEDLSQAMKFVGPVAAGMGVSIDETVGTLAAFASQGILADNAGTGLRGMLSSLTSPSKVASDELGKLGVQLYDGQGKFLGLANMAGQLEKAYAGMTDQQKDTSLGLIFGNQQITAARVVLKEGQKGIEDWTKATNDQGYAAETARKRLDNLKGDIEQLGGSIDTALIESGSAANDMLRGLVQSVTDAVNAFGELPAWVQGTALAVVALTGAVGLLGGGFLLLIPKIAEVGAALTVLSASTIPGVATAAGGLLTAFRGAMTGMAATAKFLIGPWGAAIVAGTAGVVALNHALSGLKSSTGQVQDAIASGNLDKVFAAASKGNLGYQNLKAQLGDLSNLLQIAADQSSNLFARLDSSHFGALNALKDIGTALGGMASKDLPSAQAGFRDLAKETDGSQKELWRLLTSMPDYRDALIAQGAALGVNVDASDGVANKTALLKLAFGGAEKATEDNSAALAVMSGKANDAQGDISDLADAIAGFGKGQLDVNAAQRDFQQAIDAVTASVKENGHSLDIGTDKGRANQSALDDIAKSALAAASAIVTQTGSQEDASKAVADGRAELIKALGQFGITGQAAEDYATKLGLIPSNVKTTAELQTDQATRDLNAWLTANANHRIHVAVGAGGGGGQTKADGGAIVGSGGPRDDNILVAASNGEHMLDAEDVRRMGGQDAVYAFRASLYRGYADGGAIGFTPAPVYTPAPPRMYMPGPGASSPQINVVVQPRGGIDILKYVDIRIEQSSAADYRIQERGYRG